MKTLGAVGVAVAGLGSPVSGAERRTRPATPRIPRNASKEIAERVFKAALIDTHEHLPDETERLAGKGIACDDWSLLFSHYLDSDLLVAGMKQADLDRFLSAKRDPLSKWELLAPYWPAVKNTGYGQAVRLAIRELYGVDEVSGRTIKAIQSCYEKTRRPGFYRRILQERGGIESCQVNYLFGEPFKRSEMPTFLMQDISIVGMFAGPNIQQHAGPAGIEVKGLADWHRVIDWWFETYARYAVAVKSQNAYSRNIDYERVPAETAEPIFAKVLQKEEVTSEKRKLLEDHLFWHAVDQATAHGLPVKLHTGYYAGQNYMPLARLQRNAGSATDLCRLSPETQFVFMHICYPYYEELLAVAKQYTNAHVDMCWSWIINPIAAKDYLKKHLVTAPANKVLPFGGDYIPVEPALGHATIARRGVAQALTELVQESWLSMEDAVELIDPILNGNARRLFRLAEKTEALKTAPWGRVRESLGR